MKNFIEVRIPSVCICFTLICIGNGVINWVASGGKDRGSISFLFIILWLVVCQLIDGVVSRIEFEKWIHFCVAESIVLYVITLVFCRVFYWDSFTVRQLVLYSIVFLAADGGIFSYFRKRQALRAEEINELLQAQKSKTPPQAAGRQT